jgi:hypothetical protein
MEAMCSPKRMFELHLHGTNYQKASIIDTAVKASQRTVFLDHTWNQFIHPKRRSTSISKMGYSPQEIIRHSN